MYLTWGASGGILSGRVGGVQPDEFVEVLCIPQPEEACESVNIARSVLAKYQMITSFFKSSRIGADQISSSHNRPIFFHRFCSL